MAQPVNYLFLLLLVGLLQHENVSGQSITMTLANVTSMLTANRCTFVTRSAEDRAIAGIVLRFQYGKQWKDYTEVPLNRATSILDDPHFNPSACIVVYVTGWLQKTNETYTLMGYNDYLKSGANLIVVDWMSVTSKEYSQAVTMMPNSAKAIAGALDALVDKGATICYVSGISLGGQCSGHIGRNMKHRLAHIIAFDPAGPLFYPPVQCVPPISDEDADCVEVIHSDAGALGAPFKTGTLDYWPNGGTQVEPGCERLNTNLGPFYACSHIYSQVLFMQIYAYNDTELFAARLCNSYLRFNLHGCDDNLIAYIGQCNNQSIPGNYYLRTTRTAPFGLQQRGASPLI